MSTPTGPPSLRQLTAGLFLALLVGVGLIGWLGSAGRRAAGEAAARQASVVNLSALVDLAAAAEASGADLQETVARFAAANPDVAEARVVDVKGRQLLASTVAEDQAEGLPLRLQRKSAEHKEWYDRGQALRAAVDANRDEGRLWKEEIEVRELEGVALSLAAPLLSGDKVSGVVLLTSNLEPPRPAGRAWVSWVVVLGGAALFLILALALRRREPGAPDRWRPALAAVVAVLALGFFSVHTLNGLEEAREAVESEVAQRMTAVADSFRAALPGATAVDPSRWDVDLFRQARGVISADGAVDSAAVADAYAPVRRRFANVFAVLAVVGLAAGAFVGFGYARRTWRTLVKFREGYAYVTPAIAGMLLLVFFPFIFAIFLSFTDSTLYNVKDPPWEIMAGVDNYVDILTDFDVIKESEGERVVNYKNFYWTLGFTIIWTATNVSIGVSVGLLLALVLNTKGLAFRPIYRVIFILPWAMPNYITALIWKGLFHQQFGVINQVIQIFGGDPIAWYDTPFTSFITILTTNGWLSFPFMMVICLGALQSIPSDLYEAARVDGASRWQQFRLVTLPSLKPALVPAIIISVVWTFNMFNIPYLVSQGEPGGATEILVTRSFKLFYEEYRYGYSCAYATVIFLILFAYGNWQNRVTKTYEGV